MRAWRGAVVGLVVAGVLGGCSVPRPPGEGTVRYRDPVFSAVTVTRDVQYGSAVPIGQTAAIPLRLDVYQPTGDTRRDRPAVVWVHGGGFTGGDKSGGPSPLLADRFAKLGYVAVSINYRLYNGSCNAAGVTAQCFQAATDATHDAQAAVRFLRANAAVYGIDPTRIGIGGESAGGIIATGVGVRPEDPGSSGNPGFSSAVGGFASIAGGLPGGLYAGPGDAPGVLFHGTADAVVPYQWSADTAAKLLQSGVAAFLQPHPGAGHVPGQFFQQWYEQSDYFFYNVLDLGRAGGQPVAVRREATEQQRRLKRRYPAYARRALKHRRQMEAAGRPQRELRPLRR